MLKWIKNQLGCMKIIHNAMVGCTDNLSLLIIIVEIYIHVLIRWHDSDMPKELWKLSIMKAKSVKVWLDGHTMKKKQIANLLALTNKKLILSHWF